MSPIRKISIAFGVLYLITFITSIPALALYQPVLDDPVGFVTNGGSDSQIYFGAFLELLLVIANVGTAVVVYPLLKRQNHILSLGRSERNTHRRPTVALPWLAAKCS